MSETGAKITEGRKAKTHPDWIVVGTRIVLTLAFALFFLNQIKTTELFFAGEKGVAINIFQPDISVAWQLPGIFFGGNTLPNYAILAGWIVESFYWSALMRMKPMLSRAASIHQVHEKILLAVLISAIALNLATDYMFGPSFFPGNDIIGHIIYSIIAEAVLVYGPIAIEALSS